VPADTTQQVYAAATTMFKRFSWNWIKFKFYRNALTHSNCS
jgi:hypothetical protein